MFVYLPGFCPVLLPPSDVAARRATIAKRKEDYIVALKRRRHEEAVQKQATDNRRRAEEFSRNAVSGESCWLAVQPPPRGSSHCVRAYHQCVAWCSFVWFVVCGFVFQAAEEKRRQEREARAAEEEAKAQLKEWLKAHGVEEDQVGNVDEMDEAERAKAVAETREREERARNEAARRQRSAAKHLDYLTRAMREAEWDRLVEVSVT